MAKTEKFVYDVFVSYASKDRAWIKKNLLPKLKQKGIKTCVDYKDFAAGKSAMGNMRDAVKNSRQTVLVMTPNWVKSEWTFFESLLSRGKDPAGISQRTIPLLVRKCKVDDILTMLTLVNLTERGSKATAWNQLFTALGKRSAIKQPRQFRKKKNANWHLAHPYAMSPNFTGRVTERNMLSQWLNEDKQHSLFILRALGGFGKTALSWYWLTHDVDSAKWQKVVWWSFYEGDANFENFISATLDYLKIEKPEGQRNQVDKLLDVMKKENLLLVIDGFERALRAYGNMNAAYQGDETIKYEGTERDCVNINAEIFLRNLSSLPGVQSKVLMTTRLTPRAVEKHGHKLEGCLEKELMAMDKDDAVKFFRNEGIRGTHAEIEEACAPYGFHPLSLRLLAGLIVSDLQTPGDIAVTKRLDISNDIIQNKHHVLEQAYNTMPKERQKLLSQIACFRAPVTYDALKAITTVEVDSEINKKSKTKWKSRSSKSKAAKSKEIVQYPDFDNDLRDLLSRGLLHHDPKTNKYDLHPIVRRYAYERLTSTDRTAAHIRLRDYFAAVDVEAKLQTLDDLAPIIELYHHTVQAGELDRAWELYRDRLWLTIYYQLGGYQTQIELLKALFVDGEDKPPKLTESRDQTHAMNELANSYSLIGDPRRAEPLFENKTAMQRIRGDKKNVVVGLVNMAIQKNAMGKLRAAEYDTQRGCDLFQEIQDDHIEAVVRRELGHLLIYRCEWDEVKTELESAWKLFTKADTMQSGGQVWLYRSLCAIMVNRESDQPSNENRKTAIAHAQRALQLAEETARIEHPYPRDFVRAYWLLGASYRLDEKIKLAEQYLNEALTRCRSINQVENEANILLDLARLRYDQKNYQEAKSLVEEALSITERCGYVLQGADVNLFLAQYALEQENDKAKAKEYAETALKLAYCDGPPYYYKVAYHEAERMLEKLK